MSLIAIGVTVGTGAAVTAGTVTAGAALASTAIGAYSAYKGGKRASAAAGGGVAFDTRQMAEILAGIEGYQPVDVAGVASRTAQANAGEGVSLARTSASKLNKTATADTIAAMNAMFGGEESFASLKDRALADIADNLDGQVSKSTRAQIGRRLLGSGVSDLGEGAVADTMTGYLGLTSEGLASQGQEQFKSLYQTFRQAVPLINGAQILDKFTMSPDNAVQAEIANATAAASSELGIAGLEMNALGMGYQANMNNRSMAIESAAIKSNANQAVAASIASGVGTVAGVYSARPAATTRPIITPAYSGGSGRNASDRYIG